MAAKRAWSEEVRGRLGALAAGLALLLLAACGAPTGAGIAVDEVWMRPATSAAPAIPAVTGAGPVAAAQTGAPAMAGGVSAAYLVIRNEGGRADRLLAARSEVARSVEIHRTTIEGGMMTMAPVAAIDIPAGGHVELQPGGLHIMLIGLRRELRPGERAPLTLEFERAGARTVEATVRQP